MEAQQVLLAAFGSDDFFRTAYNYSLDEVSTRMDRYFEASTKHSCCL